MVGRQDGRLTEGIKWLKEGSKDGVMVGMEYFHRSVLVGVLYYGFPFTGEIFCSQLDYHWVDGVKPKTLAQDGLVFILLSLDCLQQ